MWQQVNGKFSNESVHEDTKQQSLFISLNFQLQRVSAGKRSWEEFHHFLLKFSGFFKHLHLPSVSGMTCSVDVKLPACFQYLKVILILLSFTLSVTRKNQKHLNYFRTVGNKAYSVWLSSHPHTHTHSSSNQWNTNMETSQSKNGEESFTDSSRSGRADPEPADPEPASSHSDFHF